MTIPAKLIHELDDAITESYALRPVYLSKVTLCSELLLDVSDLCHLIVCGKPIKKRALHIAATSLRLMLDYGE